jgi:GT2 family glycosyltransferase
MPWPGKEGEPGTEAGAGGSLRASIVITTKNRKEDLRRALLSCLKQTAQPEVIVIDDGSSDGTEEMVRADFPAVRIFRDQLSRGLIVQRNRAARLATNEIIFSIDDDAEFSSSRTVEQTLAEFDDPRIAAVAIPFINVRYSDAVLQRAPDRAGVFVTSSFIGTAHALRRDVFLALGGYREFLFHQGEEEDLCIRMLEAGKFTRLGKADPIYHYESPTRDFRRWHVYEARNRLLFCWYNVPMPHVLFHAPAITVKRALYSLRRGRPLWTAHGLARGIGACVNQVAQRRPVHPKTFRLFRTLRRQPVALEMSKCPSSISGLPTRPANGRS